MPKSKAEKTKCSSRKSFCHKVFDAERRRKNIHPTRPGSNLKKIKVIYQRLLHHEFVVADLKTVDDIVMAIKEMSVRGAPLIRVTAAYGVYLAALNFPVEIIEDYYLIKECSRLKSA